MNFPEKIREISGKFPGTSREMSGKFPGNFRDISGNCPGNFGLARFEAVAIIQKNERGRTGIQRAAMVCEWRRDALRKEERQRLMSIDKGFAPPP